MASRPSSRAGPAEDAAPSPPPILTTGVCACGRISWTSTSSSTLHTICHCLCCRRLSGGGPFLAWFQLPSASLTWSKSTAMNLVKRYFTTKSVRTACGYCGAQIYLSYSCQMDRMGMAAGTVTERTLKKPLPKPPVHIFVAEKASWFPIPDDGGVRFEGHTEGFEERYMAAPDLVGEDMVIGRSWDPWKSGEGEVGVEKGSEAGVAL